MHYGHLKEDFKNYFILLKTEEIMNCMISKFAEIAQLKFLPHFLIEAIMKFYCRYPLCWFSPRVRPRSN